MSDLVRGDIVVYSSDDWEDVFVVVSPTEAIDSMGQRDAITLDERVITACKVIHQNEPDWFKYYKQFKEDLRAWRYNIEQDYNNAEFALAEISSIGDTK